MENLLRKSHFGPFFRSFSLNMSSYSPQMTEKMDAKWLPLATVSILGQAPRLFRDLDLDLRRSLYEFEVASDLGDAMTEISDYRLQKAENDYQLALAWARLDALTGRLLNAQVGGAASDPRMSGATTE